MLIQTSHLLNTHHNPPTDLIPWLNHQASLTDKLKLLSGEAELEVLSQHWTKPSWWDKFTLGLTEQTVLHRDIIMLSRQTPCWFARTVIPQSTYQANQHFFDRLAHESLGVIIFNEPSIQRAQLVSYEIDEKCIEYHWLPHCILSKKGQMWGRLSIFTITEVCEFYLIEIFLPGFMRILSEVD